MGTQDFVLSQNALASLTEAIAGELAHRPDNLFGLDLFGHGEGAVDMVAEALAVHACTILADVAKHEVRSDQNPDGYDYLRKHYQIHPRVGGLVLTNDEEIRGVIIPATGPKHYLHVVRTDDKMVSLYHPRDVTFIPVPPRALTETELMAFVVQAAPDWDFVSLAEFVEDTTGRTLPTKHPVTSLC